VQKLRILLNEIFNIDGATIYNPDDFTPVSHVTIDSRDIRKNSMFVAIKGNRFDGHDFVHEAVRRGAKAVVVSSRKYGRYDRLNVPIITVPDTLKAYGSLANIWRHKLNAKVISITGSNGKTSTKDFLAKILEQQFRVTKTLANNNNHIGVPLTILSADSRCEFLILEHGTNHFGEIEYTAKIAEPDYAVITNIGDSHLEFLIDRNGVYREKEHLLKNTLDGKGTVIVNFDDPILKKNSKVFVSRVTFGLLGVPDFKGKIVAHDELARPKLRIESARMNIESVLNVYGNGNALNVLAAIAAAVLAGVRKQNIIKGLKEISPVRGRLNVNILKDFILIDDTYNSNPASIETAVSVLSKIKVYKNRVLILGDMFELGADSNKLHKSLAVNINRLSNCVVLLTGKKMAALFKELKKENSNVEYFNQRRSLNKYLSDKDLSGNVILVKGSRGMKMEEFVETIKLKAA
jgi:UDP-N-acetylmuramoyl-tripeptide--D-alanyl-D-alanine ligase